MSTDSTREVRKAIRNEILQHPALVKAVNWARQHDATYFPVGGNLGDGLIGLGAQDVFRHFNLNLNVRLGWETDVLKGVRHLVVNGNGALAEDLWKDLVRVLGPFFESGGEAVLLPCTVSGYSEFFRKYGRQITIFARERTSYAHLCSINELSGRVHLCHDLAFAIDYGNTGWPEGPAGTGAHLSLLRSDEESRGIPAPKNNIDLALIWNNIQWSSREVCMPPLSAAAQLMHRFDEITTDRLHMSILACLMGKRLTMLPNAYFKNRAVYDYSLHRFEHACFDDRGFVDGMPDAVNIWTAFSDLKVERARIESELYVSQDHFRHECEKNVEITAALDEARLQIGEQRQRTLDVAERHDVLLRQIGTMEQALSRSAAETLQLKDASALLSSQVQELKHSGATAWAHVAELMASVPNPDFRGSRGYRIWLLYLGLYNNRFVGPGLQKARRILRRLLDLRRK